MLRAILSYGSNVGNVPENLRVLPGCFPETQLTQKLGNGVDYGLLLVFPQFRKDRQCENLARRAFGFGKTTLSVAKVLQRFLQVQRYRVIDFRPDSARSEKCAKLITAAGADHILVPHMA